MDGDDHFLTPDRPKPVEGSSYTDIQEKRTLSALRADDIDIYLRCATYEGKITRKADKFVQRAKWVPMSHRFDIYSDSVEYFQELRNNSIAFQREQIWRIEDKGKTITDTKKLGDTG